MPETSVRRALTVTKLVPDAVEAIVDAGLADNQSAYLHVARQPADQQVGAVAELVAAKTAPPTPAPEPTPAPSTDPENDIEDVVEDDGETETPEEERRWQALYHEVQAYNTSRPND